MRVTANMFPDRLSGQLATISARQNRLQEQAATGQRITRPDDDPGAMRRVLDLQVEGRRVEQYQKNIHTLKEQVTVSYGVLQSLKRISDRAGEIAVSAGGVKSAEDIRLYAAEVTQLFQQAVQLANTKHRGDSLFGGTKSDVPAFTMTTDASGHVTSVTYQGNSEAPGVEVSEGLTVTGAVVGQNTTGSGPRGLFQDTAAGADFFGHLLALQNHLLAGDKDSVASNDLPALQKDEDNLLYHVAQHGAVQTRLDASEGIAASRSIAAENLISAEADADLAQTLTRLSETQNAYRAALQSGGTILNISLLDYLH